MRDNAGKRLTKLDHDFILYISMHEQYQGFNIKTYIIRGNSGVLSRVQNCILRIIIIDFTLYKIHH